MIASARDALRPAELIQRKRDGAELSAGEIAELVLAYGRGDVPDYQMAAFCMAVYFRGLTAAETHALTDALVQSGETVDLSPLGRKVVDKHSTGGVGDKTSIALGPLVAACGVPFAKMSGRGLGHTGGTLDKLESIPGLSIDLNMDAFLRQVADVADAIVLDVKVGDGAFMKTLEAARELAEAMRELGIRAGRQVVCELTDMDQPLGRAVGNALEIREAVATLRGEGPEDFVELVLGAASHLLALSDLGVDTVEGRRRAEAALADGSAVEVYGRWVRAQGGDPSLDVLPTAPVVRPVPAPQEGHVQAIAATEVGEAALRLGAGRARKGDSIDHAVGLICLAKRGDRVEAGAPLAEVHAATEDAADRAVAEIGRAYRIGSEPPEPRPIVLDVIA
jgi:pyrimidine-nucleoside phosphorylase